MLTVDGPRTDLADVTTYTYYDATDPCGGCRGNVKTTTNAAGHVTTFDAYDVDGQPTRITDPNGVATTLTYDVRGRLRTRTVNAGNPLAETTGFDYDNAGQLVKVTMPDGSFLRYQYDAAHRLTEIGDSLGNVIQYTLDAMGNRIKEDVFDPSDRLMRTQRRIYDVAQPALQRHRRGGPDVRLLVRRQRQPQDEHRSAEPEHGAQLRCAESPAELDRCRRRRHPVRLRREGSPGVGAGSDQSHDDLHLRRTRQPHAAREPGHRESRPTCPMQPAMSSARPTRAVSRRATSTTRSIARRWRRSSAAALRSNTTTRRPAARSPGAG